MASASVSPVTNRGSATYRLQYRLTGRGRQITFADLGEAEQWCEVFKEHGPEAALALFNQAQGVAAPQQEAAAASAAEAPAVWPVRMVLKDYIDHAPRPALPAQSARIGSAGS